MKQAIKKLQYPVTLLSETMIIGFQKSDDNFESPVATRHENDYFYLINPKNGLPK